MVPRSKTAQVPVMMAPIGKIRIFVPGTWKMTLGSTTEAAMPVMLATVLLFTRLTVGAKTPLRNAASVDERFVVTAMPAVDLALRETVGVRRASYAALVLLAWGNCLL
jgi:hypothetical protein